ncbi:MAG: CpXC domain-containing protein [Luteolibacter sp.]
MSIKHTQEITCPECEAVQPATIWTTVNVTLEPEMRDVTMDRRLNVFCCEKCGQMASLDVSVMYHDMTRNYAIQYINLKDMKSENYYKNIRHDGTLALPSLVNEMVKKAGGGDYLFRPHIVFSMNEMICYIVFRDLCEAWGTEK